jgi:hypothetical protein
MASASDLLAATDAAILNCLTAQMTSVRGRQLQFARLEELRRFRAELLSEVQENSENGGAMASLGEMMRPT